MGSRIQGNVKSSIDYLLGDKDHTGKIRNPKPVLLEGSPELIQLISDSITRQKKYTAGSINFREGEIPTEEQREAVMRGFEKTFLAGFEKDENFAILWVEHWDKGRLELNFVVPDKELNKGRALSLTRPGEANQQLFRDFDSYFNHRFNYDQVQQNPFKAQLNKLDTIEGHLFNVKSQKNKISDILSKKILSGEIKNREDLIEFFGSKDKFSRIGKDYLSLKTNDGKTKSIRLKGPIFEENADYKQLIEKYKDSGKKLSEEKFLEIKTRMSDEVKSRKSQNIKLLATKTRRSKFVKKPFKIEEEKPKNISSIRNEVNSFSQSKSNELTSSASQVSSKIQSEEKTKLIETKPKVDKFYKNIEKNILKTRQSVNFNSDVKQSIAPPPKISGATNKTVPFVLEIQSLELEIGNLQSQMAIANIRDRAKIIAKIFEIQRKIDDLKLKQRMSAKSNFNPI
ncbi:relaxase/mobilization nuclease domain-containing protein [Curvibacter gracilis]|uniref:relaxase/mobilization nuclease domain-containing protein n=1 Tax=Curvibacter gracilis TaxID=230310 RepID=UPI0004B843B6|nr:relaxase/mobilization nuclease domain-containing protein [Curvibacter gracilis]